MGQQLVKGMFKRRREVDDIVLKERFPLHWAVKCGDVKSVKILLGNGEDPNINDCFGNAPLHYAIFGSSELVETLVENRADVDAQNSSGKTPLHNAMICDPATSRLFDSVKILLEKGADVDIQDHKQKTPLHLLAQRNGRHYPYQSPPQQEFQLCSLLLNYGANVQLRNEKGQNALHLAVRSNSPFTSLILKSDSGKGAVNIPNKQGKYPLHIAVFMITLYGGDKIDMKQIELLIEMGAEINAQDQEGQTPLQYLLRSSYRTLKLVRAISMFLDFGASVDFSFDGYIVTGVDGFENIELKYNIRKTCVNSPLEITGIMSNLKGNCKYDYQYERQVLPYETYRDACLKEVKKMKRERIGNNSLYDIFGQLGDPRFLSNKELKDKVQSMGLERSFPIYCHLLKYTYRKASERSEMIDHAARALQLPLQ